MSCPRAAPGRTIMTAEPKFVPEEAVAVTMEGGAAFQVRLIDCVGYMVEGAVGHLEGETQRMVTTPWFDHEIPMSEAAEIGTRKVIAEHSTIGIVITTDGTITEIPREDYLEAEDRVITELKELGKPFLVLLNSAYPNSERAQAIQADISQRYGVACRALNCLELSEGDINTVLKDVLYEFPVKELDLFLPPWVDALAQDHPIKSALYTAIREGASDLYRIRDVEQTVPLHQGVRGGERRPGDLHRPRNRAGRCGTGPAQGPVLPHSVPAVRLPDPGRRGSGLSADPAGWSQGSI